MPVLSKLLVCPGFHPWTEMFRPDLDLIVRGGLRGEREAMERLFGDMLERSLG